MSSETARYYLPKKKGLKMKDPKHVLFVSQEIFPYLEEETTVRVLNRKLPQACQENGIETRTFMPKYGEINERRNQLHEVIRLSGMNLIIGGTDHPLLLKVASIQSARIQIYFIDNDDFFHRRKGLVDKDGNEYPDNDERCIFFARGSLETVQKLRWTPNVVCCSGWMSALTPLYLRKAFSDTPFFSESKIVVALNDDRFVKPFGADFVNKLLIRGVKAADVSAIVDKEVSYVDLMKVALDYADAVVLQTENVDPELLEYAESKGLPILPAQPDQTQSYVDFFKTLMPED